MTGETINISGQTYDLSYLVTGGTDIISYIETGATDINRYYDVNVFEIDESNLVVNVEVNWGVLLNNIKFNQKTINVSYVTTKAEFDTKPLSDTRKDIIQQIFISELGVDIYDESMDLLPEFEV